MCNCQNKCECPGPTLDASRIERFDRLKPYALRDGRSAYILGEIPDHCRFGRVLLGYAKSALYPGSDYFMWDAVTGLAAGYRNGTSQPYDLVNVAKKESFFCHVYLKASGGFYTGLPFPSSTRPIVPDKGMGSVVGITEYKLEDGALVDVVFHPKEDG